MGFCEFQAVKFSQRREIYRRTRNRHTSGRDSPPDRSIPLFACIDYAQRIYTQVSDRNRAYRTPQLSPLINYAHTGKYKYIFFIII